MKDHLKAIERKHYGLIRQEIEAQLRFRTFGHALERMSEGDLVDGNDPARLAFQVVQ